MENRLPGCNSIQCAPDECHCINDFGKFNTACGCLESSRCSGGCGVCTNCDSCYCAEDIDTQEREEDHH
jgi:hypothetical protein